MATIVIPEGARQIMDADEEVFLLYTRLAGLPVSDGSEDHFHGLGFLDSHSDTLDIRIELASPSLESNALSGKKRSSQRHTKKTHTNSRADVEVVEITLAQDKTALHSRSGDTGSVLWQASVDFARLVLQLHQLAHRIKALFDYDALSRSNVVELGAGTGLLAIAFGPLCAQYTVTDIPALVPLIRKNLDLNKLRLSKSNVIAEDLDWLVVYDTPAHTRNRLQLLSSPGAEHPDLVLAVDCIYHPSLIAPLLSAIDYLAAASSNDDGKKQTSPDVLVVAELRSEEVVREFLEGWLAMEGWMLWSLNTGETGDSEGTTTSIPGIKLSARYGMWLGRKNGPEC